MIWQELHHVTAGPLAMISSAIANHEKAMPDLLQSVDSSMQIICSDYSGQHSEAPYEAYAFLVTTEVAIRKWLPDLALFRKTFLADGRRLSFKNLNESVRRKALKHYLNCIGKLEGNLICVMINSELKDIFPSSVREVFSDCFVERDKKITVEKMFKVASFISLITACLRKEDQPSIWISDHDEALDSFDRREGLARLSSYLTQGLARWKSPADLHFLTTEMDDLPFWAEDVTALADITAGAYCKLGQVLPSFFRKSSWQVRTSPISISDQRSQQVLDWLATSTKNMKPLLVRLEPDGENSYRASSQSFLVK